MSAHLAALNHHIGHLARGPGRLLADLHAHFAGHGRAAEVDEGWYWRHLTIEPGLRGASEVRRVWLDALRREGLC
jgi:hypothetical protein